MKFSLVLRVSSDVCTTSPTAIQQFPALKHTHINILPQNHYWENTIKGRSKNKDMEYESL